MLIQLGEYSLNVEEMSLSGGEETTILEPKVFAVLLFLTENAHHYSSIQDLHDNVWHDRCVSDAAVRRIISKIRLLFKDDHKDPKYLQSFSKRGYKLICNINYLNQEAVEPTHESIKSNSRPVFWFVIVASLMLMSIIVAVYSMPWSEKIKPAEVIDTNYSKKLALAHSFDNRYLAYVGKLNGEENYQIYLKDNEKQTTKLLTKQTSLPLALSFSKSGNALYYSDTVEKPANLYRIDLNTTEFDSESLLSDFSLIAKIAAHPKKDIIYFLGQKNEGSAMLLYQFNLDTNHVEPLSGATQKGVFDNMVSISPEGDKVAIVRVFEFNNNIELSVLDIEDKTVSFKKLLDNPIFAIDWLDQNMLLVLEQASLYALNTADGSQEELQSNHNLNSISVVDESSFYSIEGIEQKYTYIEKQLPIHDFSSLEIFHKDTNVLSLGYFSAGDKLWAVIQGRDSNELVLFNHGTSTEYTTYLSSGSDIKFITDSPDSKYILLEVDERLAVLDIANNEVIYVTHNREWVGDAVFAIDGKTVIYTVKTNGEWQANQFSLSDKLMPVLLHGYRYIRTHGTNYVVADQAGALFYYQVDTETFLDLKANISTVSNTHWAVVDNTVLWSDHNLLSTVFYELDISDLADVSLSSKVLNYSDVSPLFYANTSLNSVLIKGKESQNNKIFKHTIQ